MVSILFPLAKEKKKNHISSLAFIGFFFSKHVLMAKMGRGRLAASYSFKKTKREQVRKKNTAWIGILFFFFFSYFPLMASDSQKIRNL
jgi:Na+/H+ antiporter NhaC